MSSSKHINNKEEGISILVKAQTQELDGNTFTAVKYSINFTQLNRKCCLCLHYNGSNSFLFVSATKTYQLKAKDSEIKIYLLYFGNISKDFTFINMKETGLNGYVYEFSVDYNIIDTSNIFNIHKYLMKKLDIK